MNFIALSSLEKLHRPHLQAAATFIVGQVPSARASDIASMSSRQDIPDGSRAEVGKWGDASGEMRLEIDCGLCGETGTLERSHAPIGIGAKLGREGVQGVECAPDHGTVGGRLRSQEPNPRQCDIEDAQSPASAAADERTGSRPVTARPLRVRERREDARLVPERGAPMASKRERPLEHPGGRGGVAVRELRGAEKRRRLHSGKYATAFFRELDGLAAVGKRAGQITPQLKYLAEECVRSVENMDVAVALLGEERLQGGLRLQRAPEVRTRQGPPHAAQAGCGRTPDRLPQPGDLRKLAQR